MNEQVDLQPDLDEILQHEDESAVKVSIGGPVRTQPLPHKAGATRTRNILATGPVQVLAADHYRAQAYLVSFTQDFYVAFSQAASQDTSRMSRWPALVPMPITTTTGVWVQSFATNTDISITTELWATGE